MYNVAGFARKKDSRRDDGFFFMVRLCHPELVEGWHMSKDDFTI